MRLEVDINKEVTAIIKTFERKECLDNLINSIKYYYPDLPIIVVDDSKNPTPRQDVEYHILPFDSGVSKGRNFLVSKVKTPYVLVLDDDYQFIKETKIEKLLDVLKNTSIDMIGGRWIMRKDGKIKLHSYHGQLKIRDGLLYHLKKSKGKESGYKLYDIIHQFYLTRTETLKKYPWDENQKVCDHIDFFLNCKNKLKIAIHPEVLIFHKKYRDDNYRKYRGRRDIFAPKFLLKHGITTLKRKRVSHWQSSNELKYLLSKETKKYFRFKG